MSTGWTFVKPHLVEQSMIQYTILAIIPVLIILKLTKHIIPEEDESKGSLEIVLESAGQIIIIMLAIWFTNKIINYIRLYGDPKDSFCIHGLEADLIMLSLGTHLPNFWVLREDMYSSDNNFFLIDIGKVRTDLAKLMDWNTEDEEYDTCEKDKKEFVSEYAVNDFIFLCFMVGNDFLPHIPSLEIIEGGIDQMLDVYRDVCKSNGNITTKVDGDVIFINNSLDVFFSTIGKYDKEILEDWIDSFTSQNNFTIPKAEGVSGLIKKLDWDKI